MKKLNKRLSLLWRIPQIISKCTHIRVQIIYLGLDLELYDSHVQLTIWKCKKLFNKYNFNKKSFPFMAFIAFFTVSKIRHYGQIIFNVSAHILTTSLYTLWSKSRLTDFIGKTLISKIFQLQNSFRWVLWFIRDKVSGQIFWFRVERGLEMRKWDGRENLRERLSLLQKWED